MRLREIEHEDLCIYFKESDESFDHAHGRENKIGFIVVKVEEYCQTYGYKDITNILNATMTKKVNRIIERHYESQCNAS